jgi:hypothetical protein
MTNLPFGVGRGTPSVVSKASRSHGLADVMAITKWSIGGLLPRGRLKFRSQREAERRLRVRHFVSLPTNQRHSIALETLYSTGEDRRYDAASATHAEKWLIIEELDGEIGYACRRACELSPSPEDRQSDWLFDIDCPCSYRFGADNGWARASTHRN